MLHAYRWSFDISHATDLCMSVFWPVRAKLNEIMSEVCFGTHSLRIQISDHGLGSAGFVLKFLAYHSSSPLITIYGLKGIYGCDGCMVVATVALSTNSGLLSVFFMVELRSLTKMHRKCLTVTEEQVVCESLNQPMNISLLWADSWKNCPIIIHAFHHA